MVSSKISQICVGALVTLKEGYQPGTNIEKDERVIWLQTLTVFWLGGVTISLNCSVYMGLVTSGRQKYTAEPLVPVSLRWQLES